MSNVVRGGFLVTVFWILFQRAVPLGAFPGSASLQERFEEDYVAEGAHSGPYRKTGYGYSSIVRLV